MNGDIIKFDPGYSFIFEHQFMFFDMAISRCGDSVHFVMKDRPLDGVKL